MIKLLWSKIYKNMGDTFMWNKCYSYLLKQVITLFNINCVELADTIKVSEATIRQWQTGRNFPSKSALDPLYNSLKDIISNSTSPIIHEKIRESISKEIPSEICGLKYNKEKTEVLVIDALKWCYSNAKMKTKFPNHFERNYKSTDKTQVVVFDFDGTLTENNTVYTTWETIWIKLGYKINECRALQRRFDLKEISHEEWCKLTETKFREKRLHIDLLNELLSEIHLIDGCEKTFQTLRNQNIKIYIVSGSILYMIQNVLRGLTMYVDTIEANDFQFSSDGYFKSIVGTKYDFQGKYEYIQKITGKFKISPKDIVFVGNSYNDKYVRASGATTICINPLNTDPSDRKVWSECIFDCKDLTEILSFIKM